jgi:hypothetical protein
MMPRATLRAFVVVVTCIPTSWAVSKRPPNAPSTRSSPPDASPSQRGSERLLLVADPASDDTTGCREPTITERGLRDARIGEIEALTAIDRARRCPGLTPLRRSRATASEQASRCAPGHPTVAREEPSLVPICASRNRSAAVIYLTERKYLIQLLVLQLISNSCMMIRRSGNARIP